MTTVVQLGPPPAEISLSHRRLQLMSRLLSWLFTGLLVFFGVVLTALILGVVFYSGEYLRISPTNAWIGTGPPDSVAFASLPLGQRLADALIAATAIEHGMPLLTGNLKHFLPVAELTVEAFVR